MASLIETVEATGGTDNNQKLLQWVEEMARLCKPERVYWCDGSDGEYQEMVRLMIDAGVAIPLDPNKRPNSIYVRSTPADVARVEDRTFICCRSKDDAGPTNHWKDPVEMKSNLDEAVRRRDGRADDVRGPVLHGADRVTAGRLRG